MAFSKKKILIPVISVLGVCIIVSVSFGIYVGSYYHADEYASSFLESDDKVEVKKGEGGIIFCPKEEIKAGFIFYPGGKVQYTAYAPFMHMLAQNGIYAVIEKMTFNLAFFSINKASSSYNKHPELDFYIGGHSLGGVGVTKYVSTHPDDFKGLVLMGSYSTYDLSSCSFKTLSFLAENDHVINKKNYDKYKSHLPSLSEITIEGGIHSYFGSYGIQKKDGTPEITCAQQQSLIADYISSFISK